MPISGNNQRPAFFSYTGIQVVLEGIHEVVGIGHAQYVVAQVAHERHRNGHVASFPGIATGTFENGTLNSRN